MSEKPAEENVSQIEILGQKIPTNLHSVVIVFIVGLAVVLFHFVTGYNARHGVNTQIDEHGYKVASAASYTTSDRGVTAKDEVSQILRIVTPHEETLNDLDKINHKLTPEERRMYKTTTKDLADFANDLKALGAQGYTRFEGWGSGTKPEKRQWVWSVTWEKGKEVRIEQILKAYEIRFHRSQGIYIEEYLLGKTLFDDK
ncbi:hypothetical protein [Nitrosomonas sp.]|uniref:hypothetical protein n=1 Tax=Nitrosomonas sp. TaxID=42353 RepID=UPI0025F87F8C|nr:hypothetical protein [Nitrosomonas sp.]MBS0586421.1 hypothetical protein [Pseudomonadota bacterium]MBV6447010.1 hypothetical protein [Nitrosomonas sp.]